jgi:large conductance mechanosensitive channel
MGLIKEFKAFALKGNVLDLAVAVIIGGAFGKIISSMVDDILMPLLGKIMGDPNYFATWTAAGIPIGKFIQAVFNFLIIAFLLFMVIKAMNMAQNKEEKQVAPTPEDVLLLREIRDSLKNKTV